MNQQPKGETKVGGGKQQRLKKIQEKLDRGEDLNFNEQRDWDKAQETKVRNETLFKVGHIHERREHINTYWSADGNKLQIFFLELVTFAMKGGFYFGMESHFNDFGTREEWKHCLYNQAMLWENATEVKCNPDVPPKFITKFLNFVSGLHELIHVYGNQFKSFRTVRHLMAAHDITMEQLRAVPLETMFTWVREARKITKTGIIVPAFGMHEGDIEKAQFWHRSKLNHEDEIFAKVRNWTVLPHQAELYEQMFAEYHARKAAAAPVAELAAVRLAVAKR